MAIPEVHIINLIAPDAPPSSTGSFIGNNYVDNAQSCCCLHVILDLLKFYFETDMGVEVKICQELWERGKVHFLPVALIWIEKLVVQGRINSETFDSVPVYAF